MRLSHNLYVKAFTISIGNMSHDGFRTLFILNINVSICKYIFTLRCAIACFSKMCVCNPVVLVNTGNVFLYQRLS